MADLAFLGLAIVVFLGCWAYLLGLERLGTSKEESE